MSARGALVDMAIPCDIAPLWCGVDDPAVHRGGLRGWCLCGGAQRIVHLANRVMYLLVAATFIGSPICSPWPVAVVDVVPLMAQPAHAAPPAPAWAV
jgi:hypothetical protein